MEVNRLQFVLENYDVDRRGVEELIETLFYKKSFNFIRQFHQKTGKTLDEVIDTVFNVKGFIFKDILKYSEDPVEYFASKMFECADDKSLNLY